MQSYFEVFDHDGDPVARLSPSGIEEVVLDALIDSGFKPDSINFISVQAFLEEPAPEPTFANGDVYQVTFPSGGTYTYFRHSDKWTGNMTDDSMATWISHGRAVKCQVVPVES